MTIASLLCALALSADPAQVTAPTPPPKQEPPPPGQGSFGIRAGLGGSTATPGIDIGNVGAKFMVSDNLSISADVGFGFGTAGGYGSASFAADAVVGIYLRARPATLRPYVPILAGVGFSSAAVQHVGANGTIVTDQTGGLSFAIGGGIGAEYWFSASFSLAADLMIRLQATNLAPVAINIGTITPGVHATYWF